MTWFRRVLVMLALILASASLIIKNNQDYFLSQLDQSNPNKSAVHRVNTLESLKFIQDLGIKKYEVDLNWIQAQSKFLVCHDLDQCQTLTFEAILAKSQFAEFIWLDIKNIDTNNYHAVLAHLVNLDQRHAIKSRTLIETSALDINFKFMQDLGFISSYYLPTQNIRKSDQPEQLAKKLAGRIKANNISAISFDCREHSFVTQKLTPLIAHDITFYSWALKIKIPLLLRQAYKQCVQDARNKITLLPIAALQDKK